MSNLKYFVRLDASGRVVPGSLVARKMQPKNGRWMEVPASECCGGRLTTPVLTASGQSTSGFTLDWPDVNGATNYQYQIASDSAFGTIVQSGMLSASTVTISSGLQANTDYWVRVKALNTAGSAPDSLYAVIKVTTSPVI